MPKCTVTGKKSDRKHILSSDIRSKYTGKVLLNLRVRNRCDRVVRPWCYVGMDKPWL